MILGAFYSLAIILRRMREHTASLCGVAVCVLSLFLGIPWVSVTMYSLTFCAGSLFCGVVLGVYSSFAIIMPRTRELVA